MGRFQRSIAMLLVFAMLLPMLPASAFAATGNEFEYSVQEDGTVSIDSYTSGADNTEGLHVEIPAEIEGMTVSRLGQEAFAYNEQIDTVVIPASVAAIDNAAFYHCTDLKAIVFLGDAPELGFTVAEGSRQLEKLFVLSSCNIGGFCALLLNDLGEEETKQVEVLEFDDVASLMEAYSAYTRELDAQLIAEEAVEEKESEEEAIVEEAEPETEAAVVELYLDRGFVVNPLYEDVLSEDDFDLDGILANSVKPYADTVYTSETEFIQAVREYMKNRVEFFSVSIQPGDDVTITTQEELGAYMDGVLEPLFDHTGVPTEGDYLKFQYGGYSAPASYDGTTVAFEFTIPYYTTYDQEEEMDTAVSNLLTELDLTGKSDYEKICGIYDYICANITYDYENLEDDTHKLKYTAYAALVNKTAVCQGYANLFYRLALELGVDARIIAGVQTSTNGPHAWNIVELDKQYYNLDSTWDATLKQANQEYQYFLRANDTFEDHTRDAEYTTSGFNSGYPMASADYTVSTEPEEPDTPTTSGTCGENVTWYFDEISATLSISGEGAMDDYAAGEMPWKEISGQIGKLVIGEGVTEVGSMAFVNLTNLTQITIPSTVTRMGASAFWFPTESRLENVYISDLAGWLRIDFEDSAANPLSNAQNLYLNGTVMNDLLIPEEITEVKPYAFFSFQGLEDVILSCNITSLGGSAFYACQNLKNVTIHGALTSIGTQAFYVSGVEKVTFTGDAPSADDCGRLFNFYNSTVTVEYPADNATWTEEILNREYIADIVFSPVGGNQEDSMVWTFDEESGVLTISGTGPMTEDLAGMPWAVAGHTEKIRTVVIEEGITSISGLAFDSHTNLENVILPDSLTTIAGSAFSGCTALTTLIIPAGVTEIGSHAFSGAGLKNIYFYGNYPALSQNTFSGLTQVYVRHNYLDTTWESVFNETFDGDIMWVADEPIIASGIYGLVRWDITESGQLRLFGSGALESQSSAAGYPWYAHRNQINHLLLDGTISIPQYALEGYTGLTGITGRKTISSIGTGAFRGCTGLIDIGFLGDAPAIAADAFSDVTATVTYPGDNGTYADAIGNYGGTLTWMGTFDGTYGDVTWEVYKDTLYLSDGTMEARAEVSGYPWYPYKERIEKVYTNQTTVADYALSGYTNLKHVELGYDTRGVGAKAFSGCTNLIEIRFSGAPFEIAADAFEGVTAKAIVVCSYTWPDEFQQNYGGTLTWTMQGYGALVEEGTLNNGAITWNVDSYGILCISGSGAMPDFGSAQETPWYGHAANIRNIWVSGITSIGDRAFEGIPGCTFFDLSASVTRIGDYAFAGGTGIRHVALPESLTEIGDYAFSGCTGIRNMTFPATVTQIGSQAFSGCTSLNNINFRGEPPVIAADAFDGITCEAFYPNAYSEAWQGKTENYGGTLSWCGIISEIAGGTLESGVEWILWDDGGLNFHGSGIMGIMAAETYPWSQYADQITSVSLGELTDVGDYAFQNFTNLTYLYVSESITSIGTQAFGGCTALNNIHFDGTAPAIAADAFAGVTANAYIRYSYKSSWTDKQLDYGGTLNWGTSYHTIADGTLENGLGWNLLEDGQLNFYGGGAIETMETGYPWTEYADSITDISLYGVTAIGDGAFRGLTNVTSITLWDTVAAIGSGAFSGCTGLTDIYFQCNAPAIAADAFTGVTATSYYYDSYSGWTEEVFQDYGGSLTWKRLSNGSGSIVEEGEFGDNGTWLLDNNGMLYISGSGAMTEYASAADYPWYSFRDQIGSAKIEGFTDIASCLFDGYSGLTTVDVLSNVTYVRSRAFADNTGLERVWFYGDVPEFAEDSFQNTSCQIGWPIGNDTWHEITETNVGGGTISWTCFSYELASGSYNGLQWNLWCNGELQINGSGTVTAPADGENHPWASWLDRIKSISFSCYNDGEYIAIGDGAFRNHTGITGVSFAENVSSIGSNSFAGCTGLTNISFSQTAPQIAADAFTGVTADVSYPDNEEWWPESARQNYGGTLTWYGQTYTVAFGDWEDFYWDLNSSGRLYISGQTGEMPSLESAADYPWYTYRDQITNLDIYAPTTIGDYAFENYTKLTDVYFSEVVTSVGTRSFAGCTALNRLCFNGAAPRFADDCLPGNNLTIEYPIGLDGWDQAKSFTYGANAIEWSGYSRWLDGGTFGTIYWSCYSSGELNLNGSASVMESLSSAADYPWSRYADHITNVNFFGVTTIGAHAFAGCTALKNLSMNHEVAAIGDYAFAGCTALTEFTVESAVTSLGNNIFDGAAALATVTFEENAPAFSENTFAGAAVTVKYNSGFSGWTENVLQSYGGMVEWVDENAGITGTSGDLSWALKNGVLTISGTGSMGENPDWTSYSGQITSVVMESGITSISTAAFAGLTNVTEILIPETVTSIGSSAFGGSGLTGITIPGNVEQMGDMVLAYCENLTTVTFEEGVTAVPAAAFEMCGNLTTVNLPTTLKTIGDGAFLNTGLTGIELPEGLTTIGSSAFSGCGQLTSVNIPSTVTNIGSLAFQQCTALERYEVAEGNTAYSSDSLGVLFNGEKTTLIQCPMAFTGSEYVVPGTVTTISEMAFDGCVGLKSVTIPGTVATISAGAFSNTGLEKAELTYGVGALSSEAFANNAALTQVVIPNSVVAINETAFANCPNLTIVAHADSIAYTYSQTYGYNFVELDHEYVNGVCKYCGQPDPNSGSCGENLTWSFDPETGTLTISGTGEMYDYSSAAPMALDPLRSTPRWSDLMLQIKHVVIEEGVTTIGSCAFQNCYNITDVIIPGTVTSIGDGAFSDCEDLTEVVLPQGLTYLGAESFSGTNLTSATIPNSVTFIGDNAFGDCASLTGIHVAKGNSVYSSDEAGVLFNKEKIQLLQAPCGISGDYTIPDSVTTINASAFCNCAGLTSVTIPNSVNSIGDCAFGECIGLTEITFLGNAPTFEDNAVFSSVTATVYYPEENSTWTSGVMQSYGGNITWESYEVVVASGICGENAAWELTSRGKLTISGTGAMTEFGQDKMPWEDRKSDIVSVVIEEGITTVCAYAFDVCQSLRNISLPTTLTSIGAHAFSGVSYVSTDMVFPEGLTSIGDYAFANNGFTSVTMPSTLKSIGEYAFQYGDDIRYVRLNEGLESIGAYAFYECQKLAGTLTIPEGITTIEPYTFYNTAITGLNLPSTLESIQSSAFYSCGELQQLTLPEGLKSIGSDAFRWCSGITGTLVIPDSVTYLDGFTGCEGITGLKLGSGVKTIASWAFRECTGLTGELILPEGLTTIEDQAFNMCSGLTGMLTIPDSVTTLGHLTFGNCSSLTGLKLSESLTEIPTSAFANCSGITGELVIPDSVQTISYSAFNGMSGLTKIVLGTGLTTIGTGGYYTAGEYSPFYGCSGVTRVEFHAINGPTLHSNPFISMSALESVYMPADNFDSYTGVRAYLSENVTIETDWEKIPVTGLKVDHVYSRSLVLSWDAHIGTGITGYTIFRDGEIIGTSETCTFADRGLTAETAFIYTVCANFENGTVSAASEAVTATTVLPQISKLEVKSDSGKVANVAGFNEIMVYVPNLGNLDALGQKQTIVAVYYGNGTDQALIGYTSKNMDLSTDAVAVYSLVWDVALVADGSYTVTAVLTDVDGTEAELSRSLTVDNTPPAQLDLVVVSDLTSISLNWSFATEVDTTLYRIYRRTGETGEFQLLKEISGRNTQTYTDTDVTEEQVYYYYVAGVDPLGREGTPSEIAGGTLMADTQKPRVIDMSPESGNYLNKTVTFTARAQDNLSVTVMILSYSVDEGATWMELARSTGAAVSGALDTTGLADGKLMVRAIAYDAKGNVSDNYDNTYMVDNTGPGQVTGLTHVSTSVTVTLSWSDVADQDIGGFQVERKLEDGSYETVRSGISALGVNIQNLNPGMEYTYRVTAYDRLGNLGTPSEDITVTTSADVTAPVVTQLLPASGRFSSSVRVSATMKDDDAIGSITLQYSTDCIQWTDFCTQKFEEAKTVQTLSGVLDLTEISEGTLYISAVATDLSGNVTTKRTYTEHRVDKTAPAAPATVTATGGNGYIEIAWTCTDSDVGEFAVYRAEAEDGEYQLLKSGLTTLNTFDRSVENEKTYYYQVAVRDTAGNWSTNSTAASAASQPDTEAPKLVSLYPSDGRVISISNTRISALASDNSALYSILIEYSGDGETYETLSELTDIGEHNMIAGATIPVAEFAHGDTIYIRASAVDMEGLTSNVVVNAVILDTAAPAVADVMAVYAGEKVTVTWTGMMEEDLAGYRIYRKLDSGSYAMISQIPAAEGQSAYSYTDSSLSVSGGSYTYLIQAVDNVSNVSSMESGAVAVPERSTPKAAISCETTQVVNAEYIIDGSCSEDNSAIVSYLFDFGDGTTSTEAAPLHIYTEVGTYTITLTVTDDEGNTNTATQTVVVESDELLGTAQIYIVDENGAPVPDAPVYFDLGEEYQIIKLTDSSGMVTFNATVGKHTVGCVIPNNEWLPVKHDMIVTAGGISKTTMTLVNKPLVEGTFEVERMTLEEIQAAGIDITAAENQNYVQVNIQLTYENMTITDSVPAGVGFTPLPNPIPIPNPDPNPDDPDPDPVPGPDPDPGPNRFLFGGVLRPYEFSEEVTVILLDIPVGVSSLKEFFDVRLHIINNAGSEFYLVDNTVTLNVPDGLTLMDTDGTDPQTVNIAQIRGQTTETLEWILRGDKVGEYYLDADFAGILAEFNELIQAKFRAEEPIEVYGMSNLRVIVDVAEELDKGTLYYNVSLVNEGDIDVYRPSISTDDDLIEMEFFDATGADQAAKYNFNAESIEKENLSTNLSKLPDVLKPGERLTMHYMNVDETVYTECVMALTEAMLAYENQLGLEAELVERPVSFFTANLSATLNALEKAQNTLTNGNAKTVYNYLINNKYYVYWAMAHDVGGLEIKTDSEETLYELLSGDFGDLFGADDLKQARQMVLASVDIASEENDFSAYANVLNWIGIVRAVVTGQTTGLEVTAEEAEAFGFALEDIEKNRKWELYVAIHGTTYQATDTLFIDAWCDALGIEPSEEMKEKLHKMYGSKVFQKVWEKIGVCSDKISDYLSIVENVASDISIYVAAQSNIDTINFYLDTLINNLTFSKDALFVCGAAKDIKATINTESIMSSIIDNTLEAAFWEGLEAGPKAAVKAAKKVPILNFVIIALELGTEAMDKLFNMNEQYDVANNIRFLDVMSNSIVSAVKDARSEFANSGSEEKARDYMMLLSYLIDLRMLGESQAAQYGVTFEKGILPIGSWVLFDAACRYTNAPGDVETWYQWRDYVEDKLSRYRVTLLKDPLAYDVNEYTAPTVTFNYAEGRTVQSFSADYEYSLDGGTTWTACADAPIYVAQVKNSTELRVRRADTSNTQEKMTASVLIIGAGTLDSSGIEVVRTEAGYRIRGLDNERTYAVTFSETAQEFTYDSTLETNIPAGSYYFDFASETEYAYVYIRALDDTDHYATYVYSAPIYEMVSFTATIEGQGTVTADEAYEYGATAGLAAVPADGWLFEGWYSVDDAGTTTKLSSDSGYLFQIWENTALTARFIEVSTLENNGNLNTAEKQATGFGEQTSAETVISYYEELGLTASIADAEGNPITDGNVGTGAVITVGGADYTVVVKGDVDGTGEVDIYDLRNMLRYLNDEGTLEGAYYDAACVLGEEFSIFDIRTTLNYINGDGSLTP